MGLATQARAARRSRSSSSRCFRCSKSMLHRRGGDLSGGQQQQLAIGRALAMRPRLLILDEPTEGIQPSIIKDIERAIRKLIAGGGMAILLVEQYYDFAKSLADQYVVLSRGEVVAKGQRVDDGQGQRPRAPVGVKYTSRRTTSPARTGANCRRRVPVRRRREGRGVNQGSAVPPGYPSFEQGPCQTPRGLAFAAGAGGTTAPPAGARRRASLRDRIGRASPRQMTFIGEADRSSSGVSLAGRLTLALTG